MIGLNGAHLEGARLIGTHLEGARLIGAHLEGARLEVAVLTGALYDDNTVWPEDFDPEDAGTHNKSDEHA